MPQTVTPCIVMDGNAREAIPFYEKVLGAQVVHVQTYGEMPMPCPDGLKERVANAILRIGENELRLFDAPNQPHSAGDRDSNHEQDLHFDPGMKSVVTLNLSIRDVEQTKRIFGALEDGGEVIAPLERVPFSPAFGTVMDKFGVTFILVTLQ